MELRLRELGTAAQIAALLAGTLDLAFLRNADPTEGIQISTLQEERYVAVSPAAHRLARRRSVRVRDLQKEPFILFARRMGPLAFWPEHRLPRTKWIPPPTLSQDAPQWLALVRLVAAGLGVSLAPACVANVALAGAV